MQIKRGIFFVGFLNHFTTTSSDWDFPFLYGYLGALFKMGFTHEAVWFISKQLDPMQQGNTDKFIKGVAELSYMSQYVWTNRTDVRLIKIGSKRVSITLVITTGVHDPVMYMHDRLLIGRHGNFGLIVYPFNVDNMTSIEELFLLLHKQNFVNTMVYFKTADGRSNLFTFKQFPHFHLSNVTDYTLWFRTELKKLAAAFLNTGGYQWLTPLQQDLPHVFTYIDRYGREKVRGTSYRVLEEFMQSMNSSLVPYEAHSVGKSPEIVNMKEVLDLIRSVEIHISAHAYALFQIEDDLDKSYPIMVVKWCLMVPQRNSVSTYLYALQPFELKVWLLVLIVFVALCLVDYLRWREGSVTRNCVDLWLNNYCYILNIGPTFPMVLVSCKYVLYYAMVYWFGFFLTANYSSYLGSVLTVSLFREQINTIEDLVKAKMPVMIIDYELEFLLEEGYSPPKDFQDLLLVVDSATFYKHQMAMNDSFAYFITDDSWHFLHNTQKHLKQKLFKFSDICFGSYHLAYPMQRDSPVWRNLEYFLFRIHSSGLFHLYESNALRYALESGQIRRILETNGYSAAGLDHLMVIFAFSGVMYLIATICFILEITRFRREDRLDNMNVMEEWYHNRLMMK